MSILDYIEKIKQENEGPRITAQEPRNMELASGYGSSTFDAHTKREAAFKAYKNYKKSYYSGRQRSPIISFRQFLQKLFIPSESKFTEFIKLKTIKGLKAFNSK